MISIWEQESFLNYDVIIIGAGITGLSTAASLKESRPTLNILVIERGQIPSGASTRNAGFACFGSVSELVNDIDAIGEKGMVELVERRWKGLNKTITRLGADRIEFYQKGGYELIDQDSEPALEKIGAVNSILHPIFKKNVFTKKNNLIKKFGFNNTTDLIFNEFEGQLHTGKLIESLWLYCMQKGVKIISGTAVERFDQVPNGVEVQAGDQTFKCQSLVLCTNAFTQSIVDDELDLKPGRGMVLYLKTQNPLPFEGAFHYNEGYYYFRDFNGHLIFGGGRNLDFEAEETSSFGINEHIYDALLTDLKEKIIPKNPFEVKLKWSGIMAFGPNKNPIVNEMKERVFLGVRLGGMGVAIGSMVGEELSDMILSRYF